MVEARVEGLYYVYYFPVVIVNVTNYGPGDWEGVIRFNSPTKLYEQRGAMVYRTPYGDVAFREGDSFVALLNNLKVNHEFLPFLASIAPGVYRIAITPLGDVYVVWGNNTIELKIPPPPKIELRDVKCAVKYATSPVELSSKYIYATVNFTRLRAWLAKKYVCNATMAVITNGYVVIDPLVAAKTPYIAVFYRPRVSLARDAAFPVYGLSFPLELFTDSRTAFERMGYTCRNYTRADLRPVLWWVFELKPPPSYYCTYEGEVAVAPVPFTPYLE
jgi:hypothetical protein